jgi:hypothetical protein
MLRLACTFLWMALVAIPVSVAEADRVIGRLATVSEFPELPASVAQDLSGRGCRIPQVKGISKRHNVNSENPVSVIGQCCVYRATHRRFSFTGMDLRRTQHSSRRWTRRLHLPRTATIAFWKLPAGNSSRAITTPRQRIWIHCRIPWIIAASTTGSLRKAPSFITSTMESG